VSDSTITAVRFYWRPGCGFCRALESDLARWDLPLDKHNIWEDPEAAATVRSIANGNETVPTLVIGPVKMVNPRASEVLAALQEHAPHLVPEGAEAGSGGLGDKVRRLLGG